VESQSDHDVISDDFGRKPSERATQARTRFTFSVQRKEERSVILAIDAAYLLVKEPLVPQIQLDGPVGAFIDERYEVSFEAQDKRALVTPRLQELEALAFPIG